ncbi:hypothetical protein MCC93_17460 [Morococcus cerebrosus]|uniref:Uncharacterized protein n=1 Tax=Morococcus cerebrosus TaxID=1056807 RepID=A0A0C1GN51_9NEIS|nr:hypothetical protein MCC93_17460 [Morococcus cerebrosus]
MIGGGNSRKQPKTCVWGFGCRGKRNFAKVSFNLFRRKAKGRLKTDFQTTFGFIEMKRAT